MANTKFTPVSRKAPSRGTPAFERDYLLRMGYVREASQSQVVLPSGLSVEAVARTHAACSWLYDLIEHAQERGQKHPEGFRDWLKGVGIKTFQILLEAGIVPPEDLGGMGAVAPMQNKVDAVNSANSRG